jgi:transcriptional regulator with XRE-family HTH domain
MKDQQPTAGGQRLRLLRESRGKTQLAVELDGYLGTGYLQRVESGKVQHPEYATLERILQALGAHYTEQREVLELFGYRIGAPLPEDTEITWAIKACSAELYRAVFPAYLLDCAHRLLAYNVFVPKLFPLPVTEQKLKRLSVVHLIFDPAYEVLQRIENRDEFFAAQLRTFRLQMRPYLQESWYETLLQGLCQDELFDMYWRRSGDEPMPSLAARPLVPLHIRDLNDQLLLFRLLSEPFGQDDRFRLIYCLPADALTIQWCLDVMEQSTTHSDTK